MVRHAASVVVLLVIGLHGARADSDVDPAKRFILALTEPARDVDAPTPAEKSDILAGLATPFWYDGFTFSSVDDATAAKRCQKTFKRAGTIKDAAKLSAFVDCLTFATFSGALDGDAEWLPVDLKKLPRPFKKHKAKLAKLVKDPTHTLVISHFIPAGPAEYWDLWIVNTDATGGQKLAGLLVVTE